MSKILFMGGKVSPEIERGLRVLRSYGYEIKNEKGYYEIFDKGHLVGYTKNSAQWIDPFLSSDVEQEKLSKKFISHLEFLNIPYPFDKNNTGLTLLINLVSKNLQE